MEYETGRHVSVPLVKSSMFGATAASCSCDIRVTWCQLSPRCRGAERRAVRVRPELCAYLVKLVICSAASATGVVVGSPGFGCCVVMVALGAIFLCVFVLVGRLRPGVVVSGVLSQRFDGATTYCCGVRAASIGWGGLHCVYPKEWC